MYRQGDVPLIPITEIPAGAGEVAARHDGKVVLALGERTGHHHRFEGGAVMYREGDHEFVSVQDAVQEITPRSIVGHVINDMGSKEIRVSYDNERILRLPADKLDEVEQAIVNAGSLRIRGGLLVHEEHDTIVVKPGQYSLPGQWQYSAADMAPIRVAD